MNEVNFDEILKAIDSDYAGKSEEEVIDLIIDTNSFNKIEKILALAENAEDDLLDLDDEEVRVEKDYNNRIDELQSKIDEANRERIAQAINYKSYGRILDNELYPFVSDHMSFRISKIDDRIEEINHKEEILEGNLSSRKKAERKQLQEEKDELLKKSTDFKDSQIEAKYLALEKEKEVENAKNERDSLITELADKKVEVNNNKKDVQNILKAYSDLIKEIGRRIIVRKAEADKKYDEVVEEYQRRMENALQTKDHKDYELASEYSAIYVEANKTKEEYAEKAYKIFTILGVNPESLGINIKNEENSVKEEQISEPVKEDVPVVNNTIVEEKTDEENQEDIDNEISLDGENINNYVEDNNLVGKNLFNEEENLINIQSDEPSLEEKVEINNKKVEELNKLIEVSNNEEEKMYYRKIILSINMTNYKIINNKITAKNPIIRTSRGEYISADLLDEYNSVIDELNVFENEKSLQNNEISDSNNVESNLSDDDQSIKEPQLSDFSDVTDNNQLNDNEKPQDNYIDTVEDETSDSKKIDEDIQQNDEYDIYGFNLHGINLPKVEESTNEIVNEVNPFVLSENLNDVMPEVDEVFDQNNDEEIDDDGLEFLPPIQTAKLDDDFIDDMDDNITAPSDIKDDDDDYIEDEEIEENNITNISEDNKILDGNFLVPEESQQVAIEEPSKEDEPQVIPVTEPQPSEDDSISNKTDDDSEISADVLEDNSQSKVKTKTKGKGLLARIREKKEEGVSNPVTRAVIEGMFDEEAQGVYNNMLDERAKRK